MVRPVASSVSPLLLAALLVSCKTGPAEPEPAPQESATSTTRSAVEPSATPRATAPKRSAPVSADDPLKGAFSLADATKDLKGEGPIVAKIETSMGSLMCRLYDDKAPRTVANFIGLATGKRTWKDPKAGQWVNRPAYDGTTFHRIIKGFMIQGGDPLGTGGGEPGYVIEDEIWDGAKHDRAGLLCMANRGPNTNGAQFFITDDKADHLTRAGTYTIFGECAPVDIVHQIASTPTEANDRPKTPVVIKSVSVSRDPKKK